MKGSRLFHCFLVLALCLGQLAANAHMVGHLHTDANHAQHLIAHADHHHEQLSFDDSSSAKVEVDCAAYHAFAGLAGLNLSVCYAIAERTSREASTSPPVTVFVATPDTQSIRGPPNYS